MKKVVSIVFAFIFVFALLALNVPSLVQAKTGVAEGSWVVSAGTSTEMDVSQSDASAPNWLQLLAKGIKLEAGSKICHPLRGGQYGWVGEIRQLKDGKWIKLSTTNGWVPSTEGQYMSCAQAPAAGTYALFGYYIAPEVVEVPNSCAYSTADWTVTMYGEIPYHFQANLANLPEGVTVTYALGDHPTLSGPNSGTGLMEYTGWVTFSNYDYNGTESATIDVQISALGCSKTIPVTFTPLEP